MYVTLALKPTPYISNFFKSVKLAYRSIAACLIKTSKRTLLSSSRVVFRVNSAFKSIHRPCCLLCRSTNDPAGAVSPRLSFRRHDTSPSATPVLPLSMEHFPLYGEVSFALEYDPRLDART